MENFEAESSATTSLDQAGAGLALGAGRRGRRWLKIGLAALATGGVVWLILRPGPIPEAESRTVISEKLGPLRVGCIKSTHKLWSGFQVQGQSIRAYAADWTMLLIEGEDANFTRTPTPDGRVTLGFLGKNLSIGTAVPVTHDGYILTAAHCVDNGKPLTLLLKMDRRDVQEGKPRLVWKGNYSEGAEPDLALLHVNAKLPSAFHLKQPGTVLPGTMVFSSGHGQGGEALLHGRVLSSEILHHRHKELSWTETRISTPLVPGDSGGVLMNKQGDFLGVHSRIQSSMFRAGGADWMWGYQSVTVCPDMRWMLSMIEADRKRQMR